MKSGFLKTGWTVALAAVLTTMAVGSVPSSGSPPAEADRPVSLTLAPAAVDFDEGLDVRDAQGRPVASPARRNELRQLFVGTLYALLTSPELPRVAEALAVLERIWTRFAGVLRQAASERWRAFVDLWCPPNRRFAPPFALLLGFVVLLATCHLTLFTAASPRLVSHLTRLSSILLRC